MFAIWGLTAQIIMISIAYPTACLVGAAVATLVIFGVDPATLGSSPWPEVMHLSIVAFTMGVGAMISAFWPALIAFVVSEGLKLRGILAYLIIGGIVGFVRAFPVGASLAGDGLPVEATSVHLSIACGAIGGFVYWAIAGRSAGLWIEMPWFEERRWR